MTLKQWLKSHLIQATGPDLSVLDALDGIQGRTRHHRRARLPEGYRYRTIPDHVFVEVEDRGAALASPLDTAFLADALSDGDHPALRGEVTVTASGSMVHGDLGGAL